MIALKINDVKKMMHILLNSSSFDRFALQEATVTKDVSLLLEGRIHKEYFSSEELAENNREFAPWSSQREFIGNFIKGDKAPLSFKFVLQAPAAYMQKLLASPDFTADPSLVKSLILTFRYENMTLTCLTGTAMTTFVPDKSLDRLWDDAICKSLSNMEINYEQL